MFGHTGKKGYLDNGLVGERENLLAPLFLQLDLSARGDHVLPAGQKLSVEQDEGVVNHHALTLTVAVKRGRAGDTLQDPFKL